MRRNWTLVAVALATFMTYLDNNIVPSASPCCSWPPVSPR
jgi:hypothetical protein